MELYAEMKLMGDGYAGGFTNGMTICILSRQQRKC